MALLAQTAAKIFILSIIALVANSAANSPPPTPYGKLSVNGTQLVGANGKPVALHGMSLFWSEEPWGATFYNASAIRALKCAWNSNVIRAAMAVESALAGYDGYVDSAAGKQTEQAKVEVAIQAAIDVGIYVIIDWHDHHAVDHNHTDAAIEFFGKMSKKYAKYPNIIYETYNEPYPNITWSDQLVPYHQKVIAAIRANDPDNVIIVGTPTWSRDVDEVSLNPLNGTNIMYSFHFYAASHGQSLRDKVTTAYNNGLPIFVSEYGSTADTGNGTVDKVNTTVWFNFLDGMNISYLNWGVDDKPESSAALTPNTTVYQVGIPAHWSESGAFINAHLQAQNNGVHCANEQSSSLMGGKVQGSNNSKGGKSHHQRRYNNRRSHSSSSSGSSSHGH